MAAVDATELCSRALVNLGAERLTSLDDDLSGNAAICRTTWPGLRDDILSTYPWRCALRRRHLTRDAATPYASGRYKFSYQLPPDRASGGAFAAFRNGAIGSRPFTDWTILGDRLVTVDADAIWIEYAKAIEEPEFPNYLVRFCVAALAAEIAYVVTDQQNTAAHWHRIAYGIPLDRDSATIVGGLELRAQLADAMQFPNVAFESDEDFDLIAARFA